MNDDEPQKVKEKKKRVPSRTVEIFNSNGSSRTYSSISRAAKAVDVNPMEIYVMIAKGEARFV